MGTSNATDLPDVLLRPAARQSVAAYVDVNASPSSERSLLVLDGAAILTGVRNLILCPRGGRSRIFAPDFFCGIYELLHEPFDEQTAAQIKLSLLQSLAKWEPRITLYPADCKTVADVSGPGYVVSLSFTLNAQTVQGTFFLPTL